MIATKKNSRTFITLKSVMTNFLLLFTSFLYLYWLNWLITKRTPFSLSQNFTLDLFLVLPYFDHFIRDIYHLPVCPLNHPYNLVFLYSPLSWLPCQFCIFAWKGVKFHCWDTRANTSDVTHQDTSPQSTYISAFSVFTPSVWYWMSYRVVLITTAMVIIY